MFKDDSRSALLDQLRERDLVPLTRLLTPELQAEAMRRTGRRRGAGPLHALNLVWLSLSAALHPAKNFSQVLAFTLKLLGDNEQFVNSPLGQTVQSSKDSDRRRSAKRCKHDPRREDVTQISEEAFVQARGRMPLSLWAALLIVLGERFAQQHDAQLRWKNFRLLALDGTTLKLPNRKELRDHFGTAKNGHSRVAQARLVMLQFPLTRLPYRYELTPLADSEIAVAERLAGHLLDRGFWSYSLFAMIRARGAHFGIRLRANMKLETIRRLGRHDRLVRWHVGPRQQKRQREFGWPPQLQLRVIDYQVRGFRPSAVVTSVTNPQVISREEWVQMSTDTDVSSCFHTGLYHRRWEIETTFRELKCKQGLESSLRSHTPQSIAFEVHGHILLYFLTRWLIVEAAVNCGEPDPLRLSFSAASEELREMIPKLSISTPQWIEHVLLPQLLDRIASHRVPLRPGRHYKRPGDNKAKAKGGGRYQLPSKLLKKQA
jgi:hypothetical protein